VAKESFPISRDFIVSSLLPAYGLTDAALDRDTYQLDVLINEFVRVTPGLCPVCVFKRRFRFTVSSCPTEIDELLVNGAAIRSIAVESEDREAVLGVVEEVGLEEYENVSYPLALRRIVGLAPLADEGHYG
jgi:hypothetical protein